MRPSEIIRAAQARLDEHPGWDCDYVCNYLLRERPGVSNCLGIGTWGERADTAQAICDALGNGETFATFARNKGWIKSVQVPRDHGTHYYEVRKHWLLELADTLDAQGRQ